MSETPQSPPTEIETERLLIRSARAEDADALQRVFEAGADHFRVLAGQPGPEPGAAAAEIAGAAGVPGRDVALVVLRETGEAVGALAWWAGNPEPDVALLGTLLVVPEHRGRGIAREALGALEIWLHGRGIARLRTGIERRRAHPLLPLLAALGFREMSIRDHALLGLAGAGLGLWDKPTGEG